MSSSRTIKAIVVRQPWAWAIIAGHKRFENRSWRTSYRGPLAIIAGASPRSLDDGIAFLERLDISPPVSLHRGCVIGTVQLVDIVRADDVSDPFAHGPWCWVLESPEKLKRPVAFRGLQSIFDIPLSALSRRTTPRLFDDTPRLF